MTLFQTVTVLIALTALGGYLNHRALHLPPTIGLMAIALVSSLVLVVLGETGVVEIHRYARFVPSIDFSDLVFHGFLAFLLFAGALHVNLGDLYKVKWTVTILSTLGTVISTFVIGALFWCAAYLLGYELRFIFALPFGALISPTDPIAVLGIIKRPRRTQLSKTDRLLACCAYRWVEQRRASQLVCPAIPRRAAQPVQAHQHC
jgi:Na+:H+ antiporter